jgi:hypothetical protein
VLNGSAYIPANLNDFKYAINFRIDGINVSSSSIVGKSNNKYIEYIGNQSFSGYRGSEITIQAIAYNFSENEINDVSLSAGATGRVICANNVSFIKERITSNSWKLSLACIMLGEGYNSTTEPDFERTVNGTNAFVWSEIIGGSEYSLSSDSLKLIMTQGLDNDGMNDAWEIANGLDIDIDDSGFDPDGDGWTNLQEMGRGTDPHINEYITPWLDVKSDSNGDGRADILWRNSQDGRNALWMMDGKSIKQVVLTNSVADQNWEIVGRGDFNGDNKSDILWRNQNTGGNSMWLMDGATVTSDLAINVVADRSWQIKSVNDFDGDGKDDILWRNMQTGNVYMYLMNGHEIRSRQSLRTVADLNWEIVTTADMNGDSKADLIWRNKASGTNVVWLMDGLQLTSNYVLNTISVS